jgi:hypothetical protein
MVSKDLPFTENEAIVLVFDGIVREYLWNLFYHII